MMTDPKRYFQKEYHDSPKSVNDCLSILTHIKNKHASKMFEAFRESGYTEVILIDGSNTNDGKLFTKTQWKMSADQFATQALELYLGIVDPQFTFSQVDQYPILDSTLKNSLNSNIKKKDIVYKTVYDVTGKMRFNAPRFRMTGIIIFGKSNTIEIHGNYNSVSSLQNVSNKEKEVYAQRFVEELGDASNFNGDMARRYATSKFKLYRHDELSASNPDISSVHTLDDWIDFANEIRKTHHARMPEELYNSSYRNNFMYAKWNWDSNGLWARGEANSRYTGGDNDLDIIRKGDPLTASLLSQDKIERDVHYPFEYRYEFNTLGLIKAVYLYRDSKQMRNSYNMNTTNIDSILLSATQSARDKADYQMAERIIKMSQQLYDAEHKNLAVTKLFKTFTTASIDRDVAVEAIGQAIFQMMKEN